MNWKREAADKLKCYEAKRTSLDRAQAEQRRAALARSADIYCINRENVELLVNYYGTNWPFDTVIVDELSNFRNPGARRFKALRKVRPLIKHLWSLTGTPRPRSLLDLWAQVYLLDRGERLGKTFTAYRNGRHPGQAEKIQGYGGLTMARNKYPGRCYCCGEWIEPGYGHFERGRGAAPGRPKWRVKCVKCASGRVLTDKDPGVVWAKKAAKEARRV